jgi:hypothetical protein
VQPARACLCARRPERWLPGGEALAARSPHAYLPFGGGARMCVGYKFALQVGAWRWRWRVAGWLAW